MAKRRGNNEGTIYQRPNGKWRAQLSIQGRRLSFTGKTRKDCQEWIKGTTRKIDGGMTYKGSKITVGQFISEWLTVKGTSLRPGTFRQYKQITQDYIVSEMGNLILVNLRSDQIQSLYNKYVENGVGRRTVELTHAVLRGSLNHAVQLGLLNRNPAAAATPPKPIPDEKVVLTETQIQTFMIAAQSLQPEYHPLFQLALTTGMRISELLGLKWEDLDWDRQTVKVKRQLKRDPESGFYFALPKTKAGKRTIALGLETISILRNHHQEQFQQRMNFSSERLEIDLIFTEEDGSPLRYGKLNRRFKALLEDAGLPKIRFHDLRHTAATQMLINGVDILTVSKRLGHSKSSITLDTYGHMIPGVQEKAASIMDEITTPVSFCKTITAPKLHQE